MKSLNDTVCYDPRSNDNDDCHWAVACNVTGVVECAWCGERGVCGECGWRSREGEWYKGCSGGCLTCFPDSTDDEDDYPY